MQADLPVSKSSGIKRIPNSLEVVGVRFKLIQDDLYKLKGYIGRPHYEKSFITIKYSESKEFKGRREVYIGGKHVGCLSQKSASASCFTSMIEGECINLVGYTLGGLTHTTTYSDICSRYVSFYLENLSLEDYLH